MERSDQSKNIRLLHERLTSTKGFRAQDYINAYYCALPMKDWQDIEEQPIFNTQDKLTERKSLFQSLSHEAKQVVHLILDSPSEIQEELQARNKNGLSLWGRERIYYLIRKRLGLKPRVARQVIDELVDYSRELATY